MSEHPIEVRLAMTGPDGYSVLVVPAPEDHQLHHVTIVDGPREVRYDVETKAIKLDVRAAA